MTEPTREQLLEQIALNSETIANLGHHGRQFAELLADANHRIANAREVARHAKATWANRCICTGGAEDHDAGCLGVQTVGWTLDPQKILSVLDDSPHVSDSIKEQQ